MLTMVILEQRSTFETESLKVQRWIGEPWSLLICEYILKDINGFLEWYFTKRIFILKMARYVKILAGFEIGAGF